MKKPSFVPVILLPLLLACHSPSVPFEDSVVESESGDLVPFNQNALSLGGLEFQVKAWTFFNGNRCLACFVPYLKIHTDTFATYPVNGDTLHLTRERYEWGQPVPEVYPGGSVSVHVLKGSGPLIGPNPQWQLVGQFESDENNERSVTGLATTEVTVRVTAHPYTYLGCSLRHIANDTGIIPGNPVWMTLSSSNPSEVFRVYFQC